MRCNVAALVIGRRRLWLALLLALACGGDDPGGPAPVPRGIQIVSGADITDSAGTILYAPLIVAVRDAAGVLPPLATLVRFEAVGPCGGGAEGQLTCTNPGGLVATGQTDNEGRAGTFVRLGIRPGPGSIAISVPSLGLRDTARYVVTLGGAARMLLTPDDTAITIGGFYTLRGETRDRFDNKRSDAFTWSIVGSGATVSTAGVVTGAAVGRYRVLVHAGGLTDTAMVSAVPPGTLAAFDWLQGEVVTLSLDGSNRQVRANAIDTGIGVRPRWLPGSDHIVYSTYNGVTQELRVVDAAGVSVPFIKSLPPTMGTHGDAAPALVGSWVYFAAYDSRCGFEGYCLFRASVDGSLVEFLGDVANPTNASLRPSSSPDGRHVAFTTVYDIEPVIRILDTQSRTLLPLTIHGIFPQWSRTGNTIAYIEGTAGLALVNANGSGARRLVDGQDNHTEGSFSWSPDEQWIVRYTELGFELIAVSTGTVLRLPHLDALRDPSWK